MATEGHCNCGNITVTLPSPPTESVLCYCSNCRRSSGSACSANLIAELSTISIKDPDNTLKEYHDKNTLTGNPVTRRFCSNCGSAIGSLAVGFPGKILLKAGLFDDIPQPSMEVFGQNKPSWFKPIDGSKVI